MSAYFEVAELVFFVVQRVNFKLELSWILLRELDFQISS